LSTPPPTLKQKTALRAVYKIHDAELRYQRHRIIYDNQSHKNNADIQRPGGKSFTHLIMDIGNASQNEHNAKKFKEDGILPHPLFISHLPTGFISPSLPPLRSASQ